MSLDTCTLREWLGRTHEVEDVVTSRLLASFGATLGDYAAPTAEGAVPPGLHWCLTPDIAHGRELGPDGHRTRGGFLPPVPLPRRMWAASDVRFMAPIRSGDRIRRCSTLTGIDEKQGRTGPLTFVRVRHDIANDAGPVIEEDQTLVYRAAEASAVTPAPPASPTPAAPHELWIDVDPVLLFRYSALTFNGHRIHYDAPYATTVEHYPGLVIHGPLQATLLLNFAAAIVGAAPRRFSFRGVHPATGPQRLLLSATPPRQDGMALEVRSADGHVTVKAMAQW
ncbi:MaoC family dehydratase N-terminal domain-containing protein [Mesorhizobium sp. B283B1A]|uniref:FAS1-like dehydratase domain-containing protein n=1 Tax=Mesorhizobium TaxID=68287 RepID=UPI001CD0B86F|nr:MULTISPECIES: MaoC family dehydratase N-terminal domain-containing protein [Mesorhizobium]MCA0050247.1 MaoC family dehydratase N-terminal domain-containing protein [Mesorhizobium sp. B283B1A]UQS66553.1 MaoC family dehydratase N-terminal domain-containing protein [Mesorhizobium opportunistum]